MNRAKGLVSFTLFGSNPIYTVGALRNVAIWKDSEFDVDLRFYYGRTVPMDIIKTLEAEGAECIYHGGPENQEATFWRFDAFKSDYDYVLIRDVDSRPYEREFYAIREFLSCNRSFHVIRDHPFHGVPVLAGLWGAKRSRLPWLAESCPWSIPDDFYTKVVKACNHSSVRYESNDFYQVDQWWLRLNVFPGMKSDLISHDEYFGFERKRFKAALPVRGEECDFIGEGFTEYDLPRYPEHRDLFAARPPRSNFRENSFKR